MVDNHTALIDRLDRLDTCAISDALDQLKLQGAVIGIRPMWACPKIAGRVVTVKIAAAGLTRPEHHLATPAVASAEPGDIVVIDNGGRTDVSCWGDILANASQVKGIRGVIIDGASRDIDGSREIGFPVFARGAVPVTARGRIMQQSYNEMITCYRSGAAGRPRPRRWQRRDVPATGARRGDPADGGADRRARGRDGERRPLRQVGR